MADAHKSGRAALKSNLQGPGPSLGATTQPQAGHAPPPTASGSRSSSTPPQTPTSGLLLRKRRPRVFALPLGEVGGAVPAHEVRAGKRVGGAVRPSGAEAGGEVGGASLAQAETGPRDQRALAS